MAASKPSKEKNELLAKLNQMIGDRSQRDNAEKVHDEFTALIAGRNTLSAMETLELRRYARLRTDLEKDEKDLTVEEKMWKVLFESLNKQINEMLSENVKSLKEIEKGEKEGITLIKAQGIQLQPSDIEAVRNELETSLEQQEGLISAHFDEETGYKEKTDVLAEMMGKSKNPDEAIQLANTMLGVVAVHKEHIVDPLIKVNGDILDWLYLLEKTIHKVSDEGTKTILEKWLEVSKKYYLNRRMQANFVILSNEFDTIVPTSVIKNKGHTGKNVEGAKEKLEEYGLMTIALNSIIDKTNDLKEQRTKLATSIFKAYHSVSNNDSSAKIRKEHKPFKLDFDVRRFLKSIATLYGAAVLISFFIASNSGGPIGLAFLFPLIILFEGGFIPAVIIGFIIYCSWTVWEKRQ